MRKWKHNSLIDCIRCYLNGIFNKSSSVVIEENKWWKENIEKPPMDLREFLELSDEEKYRKVGSLGVYVDRYVEDNTAIDVYRINNFYCEVYYDIQTNKILYKCKRTLNQWKYSDQYTDEDQELPKWFAGKLYLKGGIVVNYRNNISYELTAPELSIYDFIIGSHFIFEGIGGCNSDKTKNEFKEAVDWFKRANPLAYNLLFENGISLD